MARCAHSYFSSSASVRLLAGPPSWKYCVNTVSHWVCVGSNQNGEEFAEPGTYFTRRGFALFSDMLTLKRLQAVTLGEVCRLHCNFITFLVRQADSRHGNTSSNQLMNFSWKHFCHFYYFQRWFNTAHVVQDADETSQTVEWQISEISG